MKYQYIHQHEGARRADLLMAGWAADEHLFADLPDTGDDLIVCYDYSDLTLHTAGWPEYEQVRLLAWSMGVWAAEHTPALQGLNLTDCLAVNGTPRPIDEHCGIPPRVFELTLRGMSGAALVKFRHRMCGDTYAYFMRHLPQRSLEDMQHELAPIGRQALSLPEGRLPWTRALVATADVIMPTANQQQAWQERGVRVCMTEGAHYAPQYFEEWRSRR